MQSTTTTVTTPDGTALFTHRWLPDGDPRAVVQIVHGQAEHSARYARLAEALTAAGFAVYAHDHRGHGRTAGDQDRCYLADDDGWGRLVDDARAVTATVREEHPDAPLFLLGHSMGSVASREYVIRASDELAGLVLSGSVADPGLLGLAGIQVARLEARLRGRRHVSPLLDKLSFGQFNAAFKPNRTDFDWLSRDEDEVDAYVADPWCGELMTSGYWADMLPGLRAVNDPERIDRVRPDLPILLLAGDKDPVGAGGEGPRHTREQYARAGVHDVTCTLYPGARHEIFNETNRDEVTADLLAWLEAHLPG
jgi:alpha-beta hydrolase superfamily lysophospholipase